jgi:hypothetical protein
VCNGEQGKEGTFGGQMLPPGKTLSGTYAATGYGEAAFLEPGFGQASTGLSFALPVSGEPTVHYIKPGETPLPEGCSGSREEPGAEEGNLCVFAESEENTIHASASLKGSPTISIGFVVRSFSAAKGPILMSGTWAVTG